MVVPVDAVYHKMFQFFKRYNEGFDVPVSTWEGKQVEIQEFVAGLKILVENEDIQYEEWFELLHKQINEENFLSELIMN